MYTHKSMKIVIILLFLVFLGEVSAQADESMETIDVKARISELAGKYFPKVSDVVVGTAKTQWVTREFCRSETCYSVTFQASQSKVKCLVRESVGDNRITFQSCNAYSSKREPWFSAPRNPTLPKFDLTFQERITYSLWPHIHKLGFVPPVSDQASSLLEIPWTNKCRSLDSSYTCYTYRFTANVMSDLKALVVQCHLAASSVEGVIKLLNCSPEIGKGNASLPILSTKEIVLPSDPGKIDYKYLQSLGESSSARKDSPAVKK